MNTEVTSSIKSRYLNYCYFTIANSLLAVFIGFFYFLSPWILIEHTLSFPSYILMLAFSITTHIGIIIVFSFIISLIGLPSLLAPKLIRLTLQASLASIALCILVIDTHLFFAEGIHLIDIFLVKPALFFIADELKITNFFGVYKTIVLICCFIFEFFLLTWLDKNSWLHDLNINKKVITLTIACFIISQAIYHTRSSLKKDYIASNVAYLPWYKSSNNTKAINEWQQLTKYNNRKTNDINYPLKPLETTEIKQPMNILIIGIDAWRADYFNAEACPNLWHLAQSGTIFNNHMSGANFTRQGLFSLFYGIPTTYWNTFLEQQISPVFIDRLQQLNYHFGIFVSTELQYKKLDKTTFNKITNLRLKFQGNTPAELDYSSTNDWLEWFNNINHTKPFFSFVFYHSVHEHDFPVEFNLNSTPTGGNRRYIKIVKEQGMEGFKNGYQTSVQYVDSLASKIINQLKQTNTFDNTLIIITADHGCEFNENQQNIFGYGNNLTDYQLHVPFAIVGADFNKKNINTNELTSHYDFVPTIMKNFLGVANNITDYSTGADLLNTKTKRKWHIASNCRSYSGINAIGIITKNYIKQYFPSGKSTFLNKNNSPIQIKSINHINDFPEIFEMTTRFIKSIH
jgi:membrane-anchored protein YejM (alkaline phosphatase superfamily)